MLIYVGNGFEEIHWVSFGDGCAVGNPYKGTWGFIGELPPPMVPPPPPPPPPPVVGDCPDPQPPMDHARTRIKVHCPAAGIDTKWCDATPLVHNMEYCNAIGSDRLDCPVRLEGHPDRYACETAFYGGDPLWRSDGEVRVKGWKTPDDPGDDNRAQAFTPNGTWIEVCLADGTRCTRVG